MVQVNGFEMMKRFAAAARSLVEAGMVDASDGRFSKTLFVAGAEQDGPVERCAISAAAENGFSLVWLVFSQTGKAKGPRSITVAHRMNDGAVRVFRDCALVEDDGGRFIIVPRGPGADGHFAVGEHGLEHRPRKPATLGPGMVRAARRLAETARGLDRTGSSIGIHMVA
jgi:hypothetical protein